MPFFKEIEIVDATEKYGFKHRAVVATEIIKKGEKVFSCDMDICVYKGLLKIFLYIKNTFFCVNILCFYRNLNLRVP
jgi:hypothetical protein